ncbi:MAG: hypothetical protein GZ089_08390 [Aromatoleum sp.]|nr:hypothetical protein [Aromatoleum sp.]
MNKACALIARDRRRAAEIYVTVAKVKPSLDETLEILNDPNSRFNAIPDGTMRYAEFMSRIGTLEAKPAGWKDLFFPPIYAGGGG